MTTKFALVLFCLNSLIAVVMGARYFFSRDLMPYQIKAAGRGLAAFDPATQVVLRALLKAVGGGFFACGVAMSWLCLVYERGVTWAPWALATTMAAILVPAWFAARIVETYKPDSRPPTRLVYIAGAIAVLALILATFG